MAGKRPFVPTRTDDPVLTEVQRSLKDALDQLEELRRGMIAFAPKVVASDYTVGEERYVIYTGPGNHTITLPKANALGGKARDVCILNQGDGSQGGLLIKAPGSDQLNGGQNGTLESGGVFAGVGDGVSTWMGFGGTAAAQEIRAPGSTVDRDLFQVYLAGVALFDIASRNSAIGNRPMVSLRAEIFARGDTSAGAAPSPSSAMHVSIGRYILAGNPVVIVGDFLLGGLSIGSAAADKIGLYGVPCVNQDVLPTGAGKTVDDVITHLQRLGTCRQV